MPVSRIITMSVAVAVLIAGGLVGLFSAAYGGDYGADDAADSTPTADVALDVDPAELVEHPDRIDFEQHVEPILAANCYDCHGERRQRGGLRLDYRELAFRGGDTGPALAEADADASRLIQRVEGTDPDGERMPPDGPYLEDDHVAILKAWVEAGASYPDARTDAPRRSSDHWSFQPIENPELPEVEDADWPRNAVDHFVLARLEQEHIAPADEADRYTLIRRLSLDLTGLPPTPEQVEAFINDDSPNAYEKVVDDLLASPHYGERWGRHWLDEARYADSHGYSIDGPREIWPYRDWVINALNDDMPFDQFTIEQLAGDLLEEPTRDQLVATGFNRNTLVNQEGGSDPEQFRVEAVVDRTNTAGAVWLGLTMACAECHTHKFDPITQREYFQFYAFFNDNEDVNSSHPTLGVPNEQQEAELERLEAAIAEARAELEADRPAAAERRAAWEQRLAEPTQWQDVQVVEIESEGGAVFETLDDNSLLADGPNADQDVYTLDIDAPAGRITAIRLETLTHESLPNNGPGRAHNGNFVLNGVEISSGSGEAAELAHAEADHSQPDYHITNAIDGSLDSGWAINNPNGPMNVDREAVFHLAEPLKLADGRWRLVLRFGPQPAGYQIGRFRVQVTTDAQPHGPMLAEAAEIAAIDEDDRTQEQRDALFEAFAQHDDQSRQIADRINELEADRDRLRQRIPRTLVMADLDEPRDTRIHIRGDFLSPGEETLAPNVPEVLPPMEVAEAGERRADRLDLARWLVDRDNPLTARVRVNRTWMRYFGEGLVETEEDFGYQGTEPTHPQLLDYLATYFMESGWSLKALHRKIVTSATYRQQARPRSDLVDIDPLNRLLARQARVRVDAEIVRDQALAASGALVDRIGGPSVHPPQPDGVYAFTQVNRQWPESQGDDRYRRTMYTFFYRSAPYPLLTTFDAPNFNTTCTSRSLSNTPLQSLTVANSEAMFELAQAMGARIFTEVPADADDAARIDAAFRWALARPAADAERQRLHDFLEQQRAAFDAEPDAAAEAIDGPAVPDDLDTPATELAAWIALSRVLINLDEFITRP